MAGDTATVKALSSNIRALAPAAGIPEPQLSRLLQDAANPGPSSLNADIDYLTAVTDENSALGPAAKQTYSRDDLDAMNAPALLTDTTAAPTSPGIPTPISTPNPIPVPSPTAPAQISPTTGVATPA